MYLEYDAIVPTSRNPGANHAKLRDFRVVLFGVYFSSSIPVYPLIEIKEKNEIELQRNFDQLRKER